MAYLKSGSWLKYAFIFLLVVSLTSSGPISYAACVATCIAGCGAGGAVIGGVLTGGLGTIPGAVAGGSGCSPGCAVSCAWALVPFLPWRIRSWENRLPSANLKFRTTLMILLLFYSRYIVHLINKKRPITWKTSILNTKWSFVYPYQTKRIPLLVKISSVHGKSVNLILSWTI